MTNHDKHMTKYEYHINFFLIINFCSDLMTNNYNDVDGVIDDIRNDFLFGSIGKEGVKEFLSVSKLADKYNVSCNTLRQKYSTPERWNDERKNVKSKIDEKVKDKKSEHEAEKIVQIDSKYESYFSKIAKETMNNMKSKKGNLRSSDMLNYANTLITCYEGEKVAHGESLDQNNTSGWDALEEAFKEPPNIEEEKRI
jgi:hypothetical protein